MRTLQKQHIVDLFVFLFSFVTKQYTEVRRYVLVPGFRLFNLNPETYPTLTNW
jgi:hypothetical protein